VAAILSFCHRPAARKVRQNKIRGWNVAIGTEVGSNTRSLRGPLALAIICFVIWGLAYGLLDVLNKHFQETLHVSKAQSSWLQIAYFGAYLLISIPAGSLMQSKGYKFSLVTGLIIIAIGAFLFVPSAQAASFPFFVGSMFVLASGLCVLETSADTYVSVLGKPERAPNRLNLAQSFNAAGVNLGPLIAAYLFFNPAVTRSLGSEQASVQFTYLTICIAVLVFAVVMGRSWLPEIKLEDHAPTGVVAAPTKPLFQHRHFVLGFITQFVYIGSQVGVFAFFLNQATETWHVKDAAGLVQSLSTQDAAFIFQLCTLSYLFGRFGTTALMLRVSPRVILTIYGVLNVILCLVATLAIEKVSTLALIPVFFFMGTMFPTIFTLGIRNLGHLTKRASSIMVMTIGGGMLFPYPMGWIGDHYGMPAGFILPALGFVLVAYYGWKGADER
jgi:FHS family L-fucose permease-like MFS transporter